MAGHYVHQNTTFIQKKSNHEIVKSCAGNYSNNNTIRNPTLHFVENKQTWNWQLLNRLNSSLQTPHIADTYPATSEHYLYKSPWKTVRWISSKHNGSKLFSTMQDTSTYIQLAQKPQVITESLSNKSYNKTTLRVSILYSNQCLTINNNCYLVAKRLNPYGSDHKYVPYIWLRSDICYKWNVYWHFTHWYTVSILFHLGQHKVNVGHSCRHWRVCSSSGPVFPVSPRFHQASQNVSHQAIKCTTQFSSQHIMNVRLMVSNSLLTLIHFWIHLTLSLLMTFWHEVLHMWP